MADRTYILGVGFDNTTLNDAIEAAYALAKGEETNYIVTPNSEICYMARNDEELRVALSDAAIVVPDGIGVVYASKIIKEPLACKVAGIELGEGLIARLANSGIGIYLLGAKPGVAEGAARKLTEKYPGVVFSGVHDGYFENEEQVISEINMSGARVLFVCLGAPKQEKWMHAMRDKLNVSLMLGLGGSLDVFAGEVSRAPKIFIKLGLEWFYRLCKEPWRIGRMMALPKFLLTVIFSRKRGK